MKNCQAAAKDNIPKSLPCALLTLDSESGKNSTSRQYVDTLIAWTVFLIVNAQKAPDPDAELYELKEKFRSSYVKLMNRTIGIGIKSMQNKSNINK